MDLPFSFILRKPFVSIAINKKVKFDGVRCPFLIFLRLQGDHHCACAQKWYHFSFFSRAFKQKKIKALRPKMTKIASRGGPALKLLEIEKKRLGVRLRSEDKHHLRKSADRKAQIRKAFVPLTGLICAFRSADFLRWCLSSERNLTHSPFFLFPIDFFVAVGATFFHRPLLK